MATYKLELGPMDTTTLLPSGQPIPIRPGFDVFVAVGADTLPGTGTSLGTVDHAAGTDPLHKYGLNHTAFHHVREVVAKRLFATPATTTPPTTGWVAPPVALNGLPAYSGPTPGSMFPHGIHDMANIRIKRHGPIMLSTGITCAPVAMVVAATATLAVKLQPGDVASAVADNDFVSANTSIATVSAAGVVTGVAPGTTVIRIAHKYVGHITEAGVTVTAALLLMADDEEEDTKASKKAKTAADAKANAEAEEEEAEEKSKGDARLAKLVKGKDDDDDDYRKKSKK
jgi:hypothetical protein